MKKKIVFYLLFFLADSLLLQAMQPVINQKTIILPCQQLKNPVSMAKAILEKLFEFNFFCCSTGQVAQKQYQNHSPLSGVSLISGLMFSTFLSDAIELYEKQLGAEDASWVSDRPPKYISRWGAEDVYAQAKMVSPETNIVVMGDYHGSAHSFARNILYLFHDGLIKDDGVLSDKVMLIITGDLADRGHYGIECWVLALGLLLKNPQRVVLLQGNHEADSMYERYGLQAEIATRFAKLPFESYYSIIDTFIRRLFKILPQSCFIGTRSVVNHEFSCIQFCHGGISVHRAVDDDDIDDDDIVGFSASPEEQGMSDSIDFKELLLSAVSQSCKGFSYAYFPRGPRENGWVWNGFYAEASPDAPDKIRGTRGEDWLFHGRASLRYFSRISIPGLYSVKGMVRGHDHMLPGLRKLFPFVSNGEMVRNFVYWRPVGLMTGGCALNLFYEAEDKGFPIVTITSLAEVCRLDIYAIVSFSKKIENWQLLPYVRESPIGSQGNEGKARWKVVLHEATKEFRIDDFELLPHVD